MHEVPDWAARWCYIWTHIMFYNVFPLNKKQKQKFHEEQLKICKKGLNQHQTIRRLSIPPRDELTPDLNHSTWSEYFISAHPSRLKRPSWQWTICRAFIQTVWFALSRRTFSPHTARRCATIRIQQHNWHTHTETHTQSREMRTESGWSILESVKKQTKKKKKHHFTRDHMTDDRYVNFCRTVRRPGGAARSAHLHQKINTFTRPL